ncbi:hypothetical protein GYMLUDRAFT_44774 [Collybiopsis luxurians FD-317 M1]|uniref:Uncharacterized protein n=1 Tax=Collybiopsis luxurians FD-317 M1 TaxID=944289 RepID=A0A0D0BUB4_9AGAR|nr:hypothetical protein GYMLUDRAFT_44774 [Collybiopsis luxurians FD-317 M1]
MFCQLLGDIAASVYTAKENMQTYIQKHGWLIIGPVVIRSTVDVIISGDTGLLLGPSEEQQCV